jgi:valyl-tRNA synthetase
MTTNSLAATSSWPDLSGLKLDDNTIASFEQLRELVTAIRGARSSQNVKPKRKIDLFAPEQIYALALNHNKVVCSLAGLNAIALLEDSSEGFAVLIDGETIFLSNMLDELDADENNARIKDEIAALEEKVAGFNSRLSNESYVKNAPEHVVQETKDMLSKAESDLATAKAAIQS